MIKNKKLLICGFYFFIVNSVFATQQIMACMRDFQGAEIVNLKHCFMALYYRETEEIKEAIGFNGEFSMKKIFQDPVSSVSSILTGTIPVQTMFVKAVL